MRSAEFYETVSDESVKGPIGSQDGSEAHLFGEQERRLPITGTSVDARGTRWFIGGVIELVLKMHEVGSDQ
jgi:hypothetical protein